MTNQLLQPHQREHLQTIAAQEENLNLRRRAQLLLHYDDGLATNEVAERVGLSPDRVRHWRREFRARGLAIFPESTPPTDAPGTDDRSLAIPFNLVHPSTEAKPNKEIQQLEVKSAVEAKETPAPAKPMQRKQPKRFGVLSDDPLAEAARKVLLYHYEKMLRHEEGTRRGEDIEELHDMRVAIRRQRAVFVVFATTFDHKATKVFRKGLRATGGALGPVRDLDVFMEKANQYLDSLPIARHHGLDPLLHHWQNQRQEARERMLAYLDSQRHADFKQAYHTFLHTPGMGTARTVASQPTQVRHLAPILIYTRLAAVRRYELLLAQATIEQLHQLRIQFKRLRYTIEFFAEVLGEACQPVIKDLKRVQNHLGNLNDTQVACDILRDFLNTWEEQHAHLPISEQPSPEGISAYLAAKQAERHQYFTTFGQTWMYFDRPQFRRNLALAIAML